MAPGVSNSHVTGDVMRPWTVSVVTKIYLDTPWPVFISSWWLC